MQELPENAVTIPIGRPVANSQCYVLDAHLNPVPAGVPGELYVGGDGLARGYWKQPELTDRKFVRNPFSNQSGSDRLYRTGDIVRWLADGTLEFIGRADHQVKLRGFRVELGEIESVLSQHPSIRECVVTVFGNRNDDKKLAAYFVPSGRRGPGIPELRQFLKQKLPDYMVPSAFVRLESLPLTANGKVDRRALPEPDRARPELEKRYATPQDAVEVELTKIWEHVLGISPIGIEDKFFELGGHSLLAVRVIAQIEKQFGRKLKLATIFQAQTIEQLAAILRKEIHEDSAISGTSIVEIQPKGTKPPLFFVHGAGGGMFWGYVNLSRYLGNDQPVFGLRSRGLDGREEFATIEEMARQYVADMRVMQPHGPYHIGGYCFGGNVAYEMARQLHAAGEEVRTLAVFNCAPANSSYSHVSWSPRWFFRFGVNLLYWMRCCAQWSPAQRRDFLRWKKEMFQRRLNRYLGCGSSNKATIDPGELVDLSSFSDEQRKLWERHIHALVNYHPQPYSGKVHLFRSPGHPWLCSFDGDYGWRDLARGGVEISIVPGVHEKILEEPCVRTLATSLTSALADAFKAAPARSTSHGSATTESQSKTAEVQPYAHYFEEQAARHAAAPAIRFQDREYTYAELNTRANQLAHRLRLLGVGTETLVAVCLERSLDLPVALLGILKAGAAYLPLDRSYPAERLAYMLQDSGARVLLTQRRSVPGLTSDGLNVICLDDPDELRQLEQLPSANPVSNATADNLAYVIYTSGSTGKPKGVQITHRSLLNHNFAMGRVFGLTPQDRVVQFSPYSFDISVEEIFPTWLNGGALVLRTDDVLSSAERFFEFVRNENITVLNLPTAYWHELVEHTRNAELPPSLRLVVIGGERASDEAWRRWKARAGDRVKLINTYGPTETTVSATLHVGQPNDDTLPIGRPLENVYALILNASLNRVPAGETGELFIGGAGVARGYLNRPELTAQKFIANPFPDVPSEKLYRTGDLVRMREDGELEFVGRVDEQVKIRGYRIELGEIESALRSHPGLKEAVVVAREDAPGKKRLVAYYIPREGASLHVNDVRHFLKDRLPSYMVPATFVPLEALPMTPGGKVDRKALPAPGDDRPELDSEYAAPRTPLEEVLAGIWAEVLRLKRVGIEDNFFDLGGHSLLATQVISRMRETLQVEVPLGDLFDMPTVASLAAHLTRSGSASQPVLPASAMSRGKVLPLTPAQLRMWFLDLFEPEQTSHNITTSIRLKGPLNISALEESLTEISRRHEALRTIFSTDNGQPVQIICEPKPILVPITDLRQLAPEERVSRAVTQAIEEGSKSSVLATPMLRPFLWQLDEDDHLLLLMTHELACDGDSVRLILDELVALYEAFSSGTEASLPQPGITYSALTTALIRNWAAAPERIGFWKQQLAGAPARIDLPADRARPGHQRDAGAFCPFVIDSRLSQEISALARRFQCTPPTVLLAAFESLLARYTGATDVVVGFQTSRRAPELRGVVANFNNNVPVRGDLAGDPTFTEILNRVKQAHESAVAHSDVPFETLVRELKPPRDPRHMPIVQVMFTYDAAPLAGTQSGGLRFEPSRTHNNTCKLDLWLYVAPDAEGFRASFEYSTALFDADRIARMAEHFGNLLRAIATNPEQRLSRLNLLSEAEQRRLLSEWNPRTQTADATTVGHLFAEQVRKNPSADAVIAGGERVTYAELNARANRIAHHLRTINEAPGVHVGICMHRSIESLAAMLGVLKAGGACVPLDPAWPAERHAFILRDTAMRVVLTERSTRDALAIAQPELAVVDCASLQPGNADMSDPASSATAGDASHVFYSQGRDGEPVGIALEHRNVAMLVNWARATFPPEELSGVFAASPFDCNDSLFELLVPLCTGGKVILAEDLQALRTLPAAAEVTLIHTTPPALRDLVQENGVPSTVRVVTVSGELLPESLVNAVKSRTQVQKVYDLYGCTEATMCCAAALRNTNEAATIGRPIPGAEVYLLDPHLQPVPTGVPGEICIGGHGVGRGYLNRAELTTERFIENPFQPGARLYRTGDFARWRGDGQLELIGRRDRRVTIEGRRVDLESIESVLRQHPACNEAVVILHHDAHGIARLMAYATAKSGGSLTGEALRRLARQKLPGFMIPSALVVMDALPRTSSGGIDGHRLLEPERHHAAHRTSHMEPRTPMEQQLAGIWREVLRVERVGLRDNFFELGGDSLLAVQMLSRAREAFKLELPLFSVFEAPTVEGLALGMMCGQWTRNQFPVLPLQPVPRDSALPVLPMQAGLWFIDQLEPGNATYNVPTLVRLEGDLDVECLRRALTDLASRHEALRTTMEFVDGRLTQQIAPPAPVTLAVTDVTQEADAETRAREIATADANECFDLARGPLLRCRLIRLSPQSHILVVVMHHAISDGCSVAIFFSELEALYNAGVTGNDAVLPELPVQYADYAHWHNTWMSGPMLENELEFWKSRLAGAPTSINLPADHSESEFPSRACGSCFLALSQDLVKRMATVAQRDGCTPYILMMTALSLVMRKWTGQHDLVIGAVAAGRNRREIEDVIGCFINFLPVRIRFGEDNSGKQLLQHVKAAVLEAQSHQDCPFEKIVEAMNPERKQLQNPLYNVTLLLQNFARITFDPRGLKSRFERLAPGASPVDLEFEAEESEQGMTVKCDFRKDLFKPQTVELVLQAFRETLETLVEKPQAKLEDLALPAALTAQAKEARSREKGLTLAIAATFTAEPIEESLRYWSTELDLPLRAAFAPYNQVFQELLDPASLLNGNLRGLNVLLLRSEDWIQEEASHDAAALQRVAGEFIDAVRSAASRAQVPFLAVLCPPSTRIAADPALRSMIERVEKFIASELEAGSGIHVVTGEDLRRMYPVDDYYDASGDELGRVPYTPVFFTALGTMICRRLHALQRSQPKVIVLDCDNTLWSGVCGEDGADGICIDAPRKALQEFMRAQQEAGRLLAVCSKNNEEDVREVFARRLDMPLRHDNFAAWRTNWLPKSENLKSLAEELNLGLDSIVFVDDNPVECAEVEANCPQVLTLQLPEDPQKIPEFLQHSWIFDTAKLTAEDRKRSEMYRQNQQREQLRSKAMSLADFVASLKLEIVIQPMESSELARVSQLTHRTNQFNCTTIRRSEMDLQKLAGSSDILTVTVKDRFGDYGLVGVVICSTAGDGLDVDTLLLSCRVLGRGVEHAMISRLGTIAAERKLTWVDVHFHRSEKNKPAFDFLESIGSSYRQALNGGYVYRFPAEAAANLKFNPAQAEDRRPAGAPAGEPARRPSATQAAQLPGNRFRKYRALALQTADAKSIHAAMEARTARRSVEQSNYVPPETEMEKQLCGLWQQLLRVEQVGLRDNFFELGGHSLLAVRLFAELEKITGRKFPLVTVFQAPTVEQLARVLSDSRQGQSQSPIVPVQPNGDRPPLFLAHGAGGDVLWGYANLAQHLPPDQPIHGIKSRGQIGLDEYDSIEAMARYYVEEVRKVQPHGPYYVGGYCLGGNVAYEMARQLRDAGEEVALVALIDAFPSNAGYERITWWQPAFYFRFARNLWYWLQDFEGLTAEERQRFIVRKARILGRKALSYLRGERKDPSQDVDLEEVIDPSYFPEHELKFWEIHLRALTNHVEKPYDGKVTLIRTRGQPFLCSFADDFCWGRLASDGAEIRRIPGSHENIFIDPNVQHLAREMHAALNNAQAAACAAQPIAQSVVS
ncbi:MAG TPA: amino acid adenylation domain-containing protein [Verrucomicrobiae bacterium]|nr:amino acid adenylation domain-containing protein [Verrucomicrobiae bacterium]